MIPFPRMHIAESAMNRINNALDDYADADARVALMPAPIPPADPIALGQEIDQRSAQPVQPAALPDDPLAAGASVESVFGGSPLAGALQGML